MYSKYKVAVGASFTKGEENMFGVDYSLYSTDSDHIDRISIGVVNNAPTSRPVDNQ